MIWVMIQYPQRVTKDWSNVVAETIYIVLIPILYHDRINTESRMGRCNIYGYNDAFKSNEPKAALITKAYFCLDTFI